MPSFTVSVNQADYNRILDAYGALERPPQASSQAAVEADLLAHMDDKVRGHFGQQKADEARNQYQPIQPSPPGPP
ncbi:MAG TPA: hypothetical protein VE953_10980 [Terriglobales bacterium]|nr:hypothetical protein [Terriglobales bacterium]